MLMLIMKEAQSTFKWRLHHKWMQTKTLMKPLVPKILASACRLTTLI